MDLKELATDRELKIVDAQSGIRIDNPDYEIVNHLRVGEVDFFTLACGISFFAADDTDGIRVVEELPDNSPESLIKWIVATQPQLVKADGRVFDILVGKSDSICPHKWFIRST